MQLDQNQLAALAAVLRLGSFDQAAQALHVTPSAISQRIKALEEHLGATLVHRGQPCEATPIGARLAKHAEDITLLAAALHRDLGLPTEQGPTRIRVAVNADSLATWFIDAMAALDGVLFDLVLDDQDHSADWLRRGEVSAAVTSLTTPVTGCDMRALGALEYEATASPAFMARWFGDGVTRAALERAPCLIFNAKDQLQRRWCDANVATGLAPPTHFLPSTHAFVDAAVAGVGWGMNPADLVRGHLAQGRLCALIPGRALDIPLTWQVSRVMAPALAPLTKAVQKSAKAKLKQP
ncbi:ArgP/LysG family DNA-binding transcriptional regulator [Epibacterium sp. SM1979]|uniref:ArgP/LysG family DNA-binding transcriptional regulator n=1 Tax=Tritonibacter litoralis TaxID=2662264 RepID=A0A843YDZ8_9RHOB|nr:LysR family transcriptional regulator ArgP [Tritonibacter litoralis]MQQ07694.1 ArgP/LysG family DNA-binding transcriptional regulator [Tritonibacter litoralis]